MTKVNDRVVYRGDHGVVVKCIPAQGSFMAVCVVEFDKGLRSTIRTADLEPE